MPKFFLPQQHHSNNLLFTCYSLVQQYWTHAWVLNITLCQGTVTFCSTRWTIRFSHPPHRFQTDFASVSEWLIDASKHLKTWSNLANTSDLNQQCIHNHLIKLLVRHSHLLLLCVFIYHKLKLTTVKTVVMSFYRFKTHKKQSMWLIKADAFSQVYNK